MRSHLHESQIPRARDIECDCVLQSGDAECGGHRDGKENRDTDGMVVGRESVNNGFGRKFFCRNAAKCADFCRRSS
jgi:hypothetical protein